MQSAVVVSGAPKVPPVEMDEHLRAPFLFRHGPRLLVFVALFVVLVVVAAAQWRVIEGREGVYEAAFRLAESRAALAGEALGRLEGRLQRIAREADLIAGRRSLPELQAWLAKLDSEFFHANATAAVYRDEDLHPLFLDSDSDLLPPPGDPIYVIGRASHPASLVALPERMSSKGVLVQPFVHYSPGKKSTVIYFLRSSYLQSKLRGGDRVSGVYFEIRDQGGVLLASSEKDDSALSAPDVRANSVQEALLLVKQGQTPAVTATAQASDGMEVTTVLANEVVQADFGRRVAATWLIVAVALSILVAMAGLTAYAIRKFSVKERYLRRIAVLDLLTGLPNRRSFNSYLATAVEDMRRKNKPLALFFVDLDNFKHVNDTMGHSAGDAMLGHAAQVLRSSVRDTDQVCRLGGDEFTVLCTEYKSEDDLGAMMDRVLAALAQPFQVHGIELQAAASAGLVVAEDASVSAEELMRRADVALYRAKDDGKSRWVRYEDGMSQASAYRSKMIRDLRSALARNEFFLVFQPKFSLKTGKVTGYEALARWQHPEEGLLTPDRFITLAEECGLIEELGTWVLVRAVEQVRLWHVQGLGWRQVAVNVSTLQLSGTSFLDKVKDALKLHGVAGSYLQLELTESSLTNDSVHVAQLLKELRKTGVTIAIDDFGTGHSSLARLQQFEIDYLKVDRSFVARLSTPEGLAISKAVVGMGHALSMRVVAEGVETEAQRNKLLEIDCDEVQGFLTGRPVVALDLVEGHEHTTPPEPPPVAQEETGKIFFFRRKPRLVIG